MRFAPQTLLGLLTAATLAGCAAAIPASDPTPAPTLASLPDGAFLQTTDPGQPSPMGEDLDPDGITRVLPLTCGAPFASDASVRQRRGRGFIYDFDPTPETTPTGTVDEVLTIFAPGGARQYLADVRSAAQRCPGGSGEPSESYAIVDSATAGDESIVVSRTFYPDYGGQTIAITSFTAVVRLGDLVAVVAVHGWETNSAVRAHADEIVAAAVTRAR